MSLLRQPLLLLARSGRVKQLVSTMPVSAGIVSSYVPGETSESVVEATAGLVEDGLRATLDFLGEDTLDAEQADACVAAYLDVLERLAARGLTRSTEVSVKLSAIGQKLPVSGEKIALENAHTICVKARDVGAWVTVDAEDHTTTDSTLSIVRDLRTEFGWLGTVLQAYLKRTEGDCREFAGARIRLCKGAYDEPASVAYRAGDDVTGSYLRCLEVLMAGSGYPMVASHDPQIIEAVPALARENGRGVDDFEYQMLYGIRDAEQRRLAEEGNHVRVYVPFGTQWYGYFVRRLAERPANLTFFLRALAERRH